MYNFASNGYASAFGDLPAFDSTALRQNTVKYCRAFNPQSWYDDPIRTVLKNKEYTEGETLCTVNAFNEENGKIIHSPSHVVDLVIAHMKDYRPTKTDLRTEMRAIEQRFLGDLGAEIVGNQALDFKKQDGITEIEESVEANCVERRLNDFLFEDEKAGKITINRDHALIGCVSNFSNFLDLFRKVTRNLELGVPCVVLSRSNTAQHHFRWFQLLRKLMNEHNIDSGMITFASCNIEEQRRIMKAFPGSPLYFTGSRQIAQLIKEVCPKLMASTGGPNTMVNAEWTPAVADAMRMSAAIENSGQCTALRHVIAPKGTSTADVCKAFDGSQVIKSADQALEKSEFAAIYDKQVNFNVSNGYEKHPSLPIAVRTGGNKFPGDDIQEMWRNLYVDLTTFDKIDDAFVEQCGQWLVHHQPISLAVNGKTFPEAFEIMEKLFNRTSMVVNTVGSIDKPALTAQARPQDAEIFGEFPPRHELEKHTKFPVVGPSSTPGYNATYTDSYLDAQAKETNLAARDADCKSLLNTVTNQKIKGYLNVLAQYISEAACGARKGFGQRTTVWGLQRPPLGRSSVVRIGANGDHNDAVVCLLPFMMTNAREQISVSVDSGNQTAAAALSGVSGLKVVKETAAEFEKRCESERPWGVINARPTEFDMVGHVVSNFFPLGHVKCTRSNDDEFVAALSKADKWLRMHS